MFYQIGIDTGGTYTDIVLIDQDKKIISTHKSLTTHFDLGVGIQNALKSIPHKLLPNINLVALSTTLSTNAVVEERGAPIAIFLPGYTETQIKKSNLHQLLEPKNIIQLAGGHNAVGEELFPLDVKLVQQKIKSIAANVLGFAVSSMFATRNTSHEKKIQAMICKMTSKPVACGHEIATNLGAPQRALTVALNARMVPYIHSLIQSVQDSLKQLKINATLMCVKGDGSLISADVAKMQPISTILSGPAASVVGAHHLSKQKNAIIVDMGGTTTDIAIMSDGKPKVGEKGVLIGNWNPMVRAIKVFSTGLGGDSEICFNGKAYISSQRVLPMSLMAYRFPKIIKELKAQLSTPASARDNRFATVLNLHSVTLESLNLQEQKAFELIQQEPVALAPLAKNNRTLLRIIAKLERMGLVIYSGVTPSDAAHMLGYNTHWNAEAAELSLQLWARKMSQLYGVKNISSAKQAANIIFDMTVDKLCEKIIASTLDDSYLLSDSQVNSTTTILKSFLPHHTKSKKEKKPLINIMISSEYPVIATGGPASAFLPSVTKKLNTRLVLPKHYNVSNAVGAINGAITQAKSITITQPAWGIFQLFHDDNPIQFENLEKAKEHAKKTTKREAIKLAKKAGAINITTSFSEELSDPGIFVSTTITATASGGPRYI